MTDLRSSADLDPHTPVLVGVAAVQQRCDDPSDGLEPLELMIDALCRAAADAGSAELLTQADSIRVPRGFWEYSDPGRLIARRVGASAARTELMEIGVLQTTLLGAAAQAIAEGREHIALIAGGEAKYRSLRAQITGVAAPVTSQHDEAPDRVWQPAREIWSPLEEEYGLLMPVNQYSIIETALRHAEGVSVAPHREDVARLWAEFSRVAADNPDAWKRRAVTAEQILSSDNGNRMLAFPYAKLHNSQWNVDQAAGLILCSVAVARRHGIPEEGWIFPRSVAESNHMQPLSQRRDLHRSLGFRLAGQRALPAASLSIAEIRHYELYSCFPVAVRVQQRELGVPEGRALTMTGGMAFAGGPLNNFVLQAVVRMAQVLRADRGSSALVTAVSGMLTKQGVSVWSSSPPPGRFEFADVTDAVAAAAPDINVVSGCSGTATIAAYTVLFEGPTATRAVAICDLRDGTRTVAASTAKELVAAMIEREYCGATIEIGVGCPWQ